MDEKDPIGNISTRSNDINTIHLRERIEQNFLLIWLDPSIDRSNQVIPNNLLQLKNIFGEINVFADPDEAIDFLTETHQMKAFLIVEGTIGQHIVPRIHDIPQLNTIYILHKNQSEDEKWTKAWKKVKGIHKDIRSISETIRLAVNQHSQDFIAVSFVPISESTSNIDLNQLEPSFMYTQIFKEILLEIPHNQQLIKDFIQYLRHDCVENTAAPEIIDEFERDYCPQSAITWYTRAAFLFETLNDALRTLKSGPIINMGFFICDLHQQIEELHRKQVSNYHGKPFVVYRGQGLSKINFEKLLKTKGGLMSFNNFLSTSEYKDVSLGFATAASTNTDIVRILFQITVDPSISSAPFASIQELSHFKTEGEILFSMHTIFRVGEITKIENEESFYEVELKLTADNDQGLRTLTHHIQEEVQDETGWKRLGLLLLKITHYDRAEELYSSLLEKTSDPNDKMVYYNNLGYLEGQRGSYNKAIEYHEKAIEICEKILPGNDPNTATCYNNIGLVYNYVGNYSEALEFLTKALEMRNKILHPNHPDLAASNNNIGLVYDNMGDHPEALRFYKNALEIRQKTLPSNHPGLATSYNNIGGVYISMEEYSEALDFYQKALEINQKTLPPDHPDLATNYGNIGGVYKCMEEYAKALEYYEKDLEICQKSLPPNHPDLATTYNNIALVYKNMEEYSKALEYHEKDLQICRETLPPNHPGFTTSYYNIGAVYDSMGEYSKALEFYNKGLEICQKTLPSDHPDLATFYSNIGEVYENMAQYSKAIEYYEKELEIYQKTFPPNYPDLATSYNNIALMYKNMGEYSKALSYLNRALQTVQPVLPKNDSIIKTLLKNIADVNKML